MKYAATGIASPQMTGYDKLKASAMFGGGYPISTITGTPPLSFKANGKPLASWSISGQTVQNGTPTPATPIYPEFVGERTANLFGGETNIYPNSSGTMVVGSTCVSSVFDISNINNITLHTDLSLLNSSIIRIGLSNQPIVAGSSVTRFSCGNETLDVSEFSYMCVSCAYNGIPESNPEKIMQATMVNEGSTALPYEPYGYKLPITCGAQTTPIYLGQVQTTRRIKKVVFDGTEQGWGKNTGLTNSNAFSIAMPNWVGNRRIGYCTHYQNVTDAQAAEGIFFGNSLNILTALADGLDDVTKFKQWLSDQYTAGTPVVVWYVLAEPETAAVNEPLCKIGDYTDTVASTNIGAPSIPTSKGANTLTVDTELQPSSVSITGKIKEV